jgi:hypothetical protein
MAADPHAPSLSMLLRVRVCVRQRCSWFAYYYWLDDADAPDFARCVAIHRKPGYDPAGEKRKRNKKTWLPSLPEINQSYTLPVRRNGFLLDLRLIRVFSLCGIHLLVRPLDWTIMFEQCVYKGSNRQSVQLHPRVTPPSLRAAWPHASLATIRPVGHHSPIHD